MYLKQLDTTIYSIMSFAIFKRQDYSFDIDSFFHYVRGKIEITSEQSIYQFIFVLEVPNIYSVTLFIAKNVFQKMQKVIARGRGRTYDLGLIRPTL